MFKKLLLAGALIALPMMFTGEKASAFGGIGIGFGHGYGYGYGVARPALPIAPYYGVHGRSRVVTPYSAYRYGGYGVGYGRSCSPYGYGYGVRRGHQRHHAVPYGGPGISLRFGF